MGIAEAASECAGVSDLAPWVVSTTQGATSLLLGPDLRLVRSTPTDDGVDAGAVGRPAGLTGPTDATPAGFVHRDRAGVGVPGTSRPQAHLAVSAGTAVQGVVVAGADVASELCESLAERISVDSGGRWAVLSSLDFAAYDRDTVAATGTDRFAILVAHGEQAQYDFVSRHPAWRVLQVGESFEGTYIRGSAPVASDGPWSQDRPRWAFEARLDRLGFADRPVPLVWRLTGDPDACARAIVVATGLDHDHAVLVRDQRVVAFATPAALSRTPLRRLHPEQAWTFGAIRGFAVEPGAVRGSFVAHCRTPAGGIEQLEGNSGKGLDEATAALGAFGEAVERFAAFDANRTLLPAPPTMPHLPLTDFHPYGSAWDTESAQVGAPVDLVVGSDLRDHRAVAVPRVLVVFPATGERRPSNGSTTGLAAGADETSATLRGLREVLERDSLYSCFSGLRPALRLDPTDALDRIGLAGAFPGPVWFLHWPRAGLVLPDVHAFLHDPELGLLVRASGSGLDFDEALAGAATELCQVHHQARRAHHAGVPTSAVHARWSRPEVVDEARRYLDAQRQGPAPAVPYADDEAQLEHLTDGLSRLDRAAVAVTLPLRGPDWCVVRVLVTGALTTPHPAVRGVGARLDGRLPWRHGIPT